MSRYWEEDKDDLHGKIANLVKQKVEADMRAVDDRVIDAIVRVYKLHNEGMECPCDYCLGMRMAADLAHIDNSKNEFVVMDF